MSKKQNKSAEKILFLLFTAIMIILFTGCASTVGKTLTIINSTDYPINSFDVRPDELPGVIKNRIYLISLDDEPLQAGEERVVKIKIPNKYISGEWVLTTNGNVDGTSTSKEDIMGKIWEEGTGGFIIYYDYEFGCFIFDTIKG
jgi:hypothetical protein